MVILHLTFGMLQYFTIHLLARGLPLNNLINQKECLL